MGRGGKVAEKRLKMSLDAYSKKHNLWFTKLKDTGTYKAEDVADYILSVHRKLHAIEVKQVSLYKDRDRFKFSRLTKRGQLKRLIKFEGLGTNHRAWVLIIFWNRSMISSPTYLVPVKIVREFIDNHERKSLTEEQMSSYWESYKLRVWNRKYLKLDPLF